MAETADNLAKKYGITREAQDDYAYRSMRRSLLAVPDLALGVLRAAQHCRGAARFEHEPGAGLVETSEVVERAVVAERVIDIAVARALARSREHRHAAASGVQRSGQTRAPLGVHGRSHARTVAARPVAARRECIGYAARLLATNRKPPCTTEDWAAAACG